jgi:hypothetical protein
VGPADYSNGHTATATHFYKDIWADFYRWKIENARQEMQELCVSSPVNHSIRKGNDYPTDTEEDDWKSDHSYPSSYCPSTVDAEESDHDLSFLAFKDPTSDSVKLSIRVHRQLPDELVDDDQLTFEADSYYVSMKSAFQEASSGIDREFTPHPKYFSCASASRNLPHTSDNPGLDFSAFEDDPAFDHPRYLEFYPTFLWQTDLIDPDGEFLAINSRMKWRA